MGGLPTALGAAHDYSHASNPLAFLMRHHSGALLHGRQGGRFPHAVRSAVVTRRAQDYQSYQICG